jgi:hypothetical protein
LNPDFDLLIKSYDVLIFTETKTDEFDELKLPEDYTYFAKQREKNHKNSGGIIIVFKKTVCLNVCILLSLTPNMFNGLNLRNV